MCFVYEGNLEIVFVDEIIFVGNGEEFVFVDVIGFDWFEDLGFYEVFYMGFSNDGYWNFVFDFFDYGRIGYLGNVYGVGVGFGDVDIVSVGGFSYFGLVGGGDFDYGFVVEYLG